MISYASLPESIWIEHVEVLVGTSQSKHSPPTLPQFPEHGQTS